MTEPATIHLPQKDNPEGGHLRTISKLGLVQEMHLNLDHVNELCVADIMIPRADIKGIDAEKTHEKILQQLASGQYSRYPVYRDTLDKVTGIVHVKDVFHSLVDNRTLDLDALQHPCLFVAPSMHILDLLLEMREKRAYLALVIDEFGGNDGLVTIEDILEQIVGTINDEHDHEEEVALIRESPSKVLTSAQIRLSSLEEEIGSFQSPDDLREDVDTLGGLLYGMLGRIPKRGELIGHESGLKFEIVEVDQRKIRAVRIHNIP